MSRGTSVRLRNVLTNGFECVMAFTFDLEKWKTPPTLAASLSALVLPWPPVSYLLVPSSDKGGSPFYPGHFDVLPLLFGCG